MQALLHKCNTSQIDRFGAAQQNNSTTLRVTCGFFFEAKHLKTDIVAHQLSPFFTDVFCSNQSAFVSAPALRPPLLRQFAKITNGDVVHAGLFSYRHGSVNCTIRPFYPSLVSLHCWPLAHCRLCQIFCLFSAEDPPPLCRGHAVTASPPPVSYSGI